MIPTRQAVIVFGDIGRVIPAVSEKEGAALAFGRLAPTVTVDTCLDLRLAMRA